MYYRKEIDGLRALAILPVIFFHAKINLFSGGYVGVDIFFVISGYLITSLIIKEIANSSFSIANFYERRARRILPALFFVTIISLVTIVLMTPFQVINFLKIVTSVFFFASNILFWRQDGYFNNSSETNPLIHTWSLSVEEQFYLFFPLFFIIINKFSSRVILYSISFILMGSFLISNYGAFFGRGWGAFYLLPFRVWELLFGSLIAYLTHEKKIKCSNFLSFFGLGLICLSIFTFNEETPTPSVFTLIPVIGTSLIISFTNKNNYLYNILSNKLLVYIGLISYSLYLWHQPLFAFFRLYNLYTLDYMQISFLIIISFIFAYISWRFIEKPFRNRQNFNQKQIFCFSLLIIFLGFTFCFIGIKKDGYKNLLFKYNFKHQQINQIKIVEESINYNFYEKMENKECKIWFKYNLKETEKKLNNCFKKFNKVNVLFGDSHAMNLHNIFSKSEKIPFLISFTDGGCRIKKVHENECYFKDFIFFVNKYKHKIENIYYHQSGSHLLSYKKKNIADQRIFDKKNYDIRNKSIEIIINELSQYRKTFDKKIIWIGPFIEYRFDPIKSIFWDDAKRIHPNSKEIFFDLESKLIDYTKNIESINYLSFSNLINFPNNLFVDNCAVWRNEDHLSSCGEQLLSKEKYFNFKKLSSF
jgi:peptidoglycan/LPS O-acetylase OafA/YrhL